MNPDETQTNNRMRPAKEKWIIGALIVLIITAAFNVARLSGFSFDVRDFAASIGLATDENIPYQGACYSEVTLTETKQDNDKISFTLAGVKSFFGKYDTLVPTYYPEDGALYIVETVDSRGTVLGQYELSSGRYLNAETFGEKPEGKMIEFQSAPTKIVLPHNPKISKLRVTEGSGGTGILSEIPFTSSTGCSPSVELRVNGNLNPDPVLYNTKMKLSYEAKGAEIRYCRPAGHHVPLDNGKVWTRLGNIYGNYNEYKLIAKHDTKGYTSSNKISFLISSTDSAQTSNTAINDGRWNHVCITFVDSTDVVSYFFNGGTDGASSNATAFVHSASKTIGNRSGGGSSTAFNGSIDDVRVYSRALSAGEITQLYNLGAATKISATSKGLPGVGLNNGLVGHWTFDGPKMLSNVADSCISGNTGYLVHSGSGTTTTAGKLGQALSFDGVDDYVIVNNNAAFNSQSA